MKVVNLIVESVKRIKNVVITPSGWTVKIAGKNAQGKTSLLDALMYAIEGEKNIPDDPRHAGAEKGVVDIDLGEYRIKRMFTAKGTTLIVEGKDGKVQKAQQFLNQLLGENATDVMSFMSRPPAKQREILAKLVGLDTSAFEAAEKKAYDERAEIGRKIERIKGAMQSLKWVDGKPDTEVNAEALKKELDEVLDHNRNIKKLRREKCDLETDIANLKKQLDKLQKDIAGKEEEVASIDIELLGNDLKDENETFRKVREIDAENMIIRDNRKYSETRDALRAQEKAYEEKTAEVLKYRFARDDAIADAKFPVEGLSFGENCVMFNGRDLAEASGAEKIMVGIGIASKCMPSEGLRLLRCDNATEIDSDNMRKIEEMAERERVQIWLAMVMNKQEAGDGSEIFIEDGQVKK